MEGDNILKRKLIIFIKFFILLKLISFLIFYFIYGPEKLAVSYFSDLFIVLITDKRNLVSYVVNVSHRGESERNMEDY